MKRFILMFLSALLLLGTFAGCAAKNTDAYYGDVKLEYVEETYEPEKIRLDNEWLQRKSREAAEGLDLSKLKELLTYLEKIDALLNRYFFQSSYEVTGIVHFSNDVWGIRFAHRNDLPPAMDACDEYYYFREADGEIFNSDFDWYCINLWSDFLDY